MDISYFMDILFDLINESDALDVQEIEADLQNNVFHVTVSEGKSFDVQIKKAPSDEGAGCEAD